MGYENKKNLPRETIHINTLLIVPECSIRFSETHHKEFSLQLSSPPLIHVVQSDTSSLSLLNLRMRTKGNQRAANFLLTVGSTEGFNNTLKQELWQGHLLRIHSKVLLLKMLTKETFELVMYLTMRLLMQAHNQAKNTLKCRLNFLQCKPPR